MPGDVRTVIVVRDGARPDVRKMLDRMFDAMTEAKGDRTTIRKAGRTITIVPGKDPRAIWDEGVTPSSARKKRSIGSWPRSTANCRTW